MKRHYMTVDALSAEALLSFHFIAELLVFWTDVCGFNMEDDNIKKQHTKIVTSSTISDDC